jgi:hypothetical protein
MIVDPDDAPPIASVPKSGFLLLITIFLSFTNAYAPFFINTLSRT